MSHDTRCLRPSRPHLSFQPPRRRLFSSLSSSWTSTLTMAASKDALLTALFIVRLAFPTALLATALSLLTIKPRPATNSQSPITSVIVSLTTPRRSLILSLLSLVALTYFLDGLALVLHSILSKTWQGTPAHDWWRTQWSGLDIEAIVGLLATGSLAVLGVWKETQGVTVWTKRQPKIWALLALSGTIVEVALVASTVNFTQKGEFRNHFKLIVTNLSRSSHRYSGIASNRTAQNPYTPSLSLSPVPSTTPRSTSTGYSVPAHQLCSCFRSSRDRGWSGQRGPSGRF